MMWGPLMSLYSLRKARTAMVWMVLPRPMSSARMPLIPLSQRLIIQLSPTSWQYLSSPPFSTLGCSVSLEKGLYSASPFSSYFSRDSNLERRKDVQYSACLTRLSISCWGVALGPACMCFIFCRMPFFNSCRFSWSLFMLASHSKTPPGNKLTDGAQIYMKEKERVEQAQSAQPVPISIIEAPTFHHHPLLIHLTNRMKHFEQSLKKELTFLNNNTVFHQNGSVWSLLQLFKKMKENASYPCRYVEEAASKNNSRTIFGVLKWFICLHEALQKAKFPVAVVKILEILDGLKYAAEKKYDEYLMERMVKPYRQYLGKLAEVLRSRLSLPQSSSEKAQQSQLAYCEYNLMVFACGELLEPSLQLQGFLVQYYPCLNNYVCLLGRDMARMHRRVRQAHRQQLIPDLTPLEIEKLGDLVSPFRRHQNDRFRTWLQIQTDAESQSIESERSIEMAVEGRHEDEVVEEWRESVACDIKP